MALENTTKAALAIRQQLDLAKGNIGKPQGKKGNGVERNGAKSILGQVIWKMLDLWEKRSSIIRLASRAKREEDAWTGPDVWWNTRDWPSWWVITWDSHIDKGATLPIMKRYTGSERFYCQRGILLKKPWFWYRSVKPERQILGEWRSMGSQQSSCHSKETDIKRSWGERLLIHSLYRLNGLVIKGKRPTKRNWANDQKTSLHTNHSFYASDGKRRTFLSRGEKGCPREEGEAKENEKGRENLSHYSVSERTPPSWEKTTSIRSPSYPHRCLREKRAIRMS